MLTFDESLRGLSPGAAVNFHGVDIGEVTEISVDYDATAKKFLFPVSINVYPERIRSRYLEGAVRPERKAHALVASMIEQGVRAQLRTGSLLTGQLYIAIDFFPNVTKVAPQPELTPMPIPTIPGDLEELQNTVVHIAHTNTIRSGSSGSLNLPSRSCSTMRRRCTRMSRPLRAISRISF